MEHHIIIENGRLNLAGKPLVHVRQSGDCEVVTTDNMQMILREALQDEYMTSDILKEADQIWFHGKVIAECKSDSILMVHEGPIEIANENFHVDQDTQHQQDPNNERITVARSVAEPITIAYLALGAESARRAGTTLDHLDGHTGFISSATSYSLFCDDVADHFEGRGRLCSNWIQGVLHPLGLEIGYAVLCLTGSARDYRIISHTLRLLLNCGYEPAMAAEAVQMAATARFSHMTPPELAATILHNAYDNDLIIADQYDHDCILRSLLQCCLTTFEYPVHSYKSVGTYVKGLKLLPASEPVFH